MTRSTLLCSLVLAGACSEPSGSSQATEAEPQEAAPSPGQEAFVGCTSTWTNSQSDDLRVETYDGRGNLVLVAHTSGADLDPHRVTTIEWILDRASVRIREDWSDDDSLSGFTEYDASGHPSTRVLKYPGSTDTTTYVNTYDNGLLTESEASYSGSDEVSHLEYDACENPIWMETPLSDGSVCTIETTWDYSEGCTPALSVETAGGPCSSTTLDTTYDSEGRPTTQVYRGQVTYDYSGTWDCPG